MHFSALQQHPARAVDFFCCALGNPQSPPCLHSTEDPLFTFFSLPSPSASSNSSSSSMTPRCLLLSVPVLLFFLVSAWCSPVCNNQCCRFVEEFPVRLKRLRQDFAQIRGFYEANDDIETALLDQSVQHSFESNFACQAMNSILEFYLNTVLPSAVAGVTEETTDLKPHVESIQQIFDELKSDVTRCRHYFHCKNQFDIRSLNSTYTQMQNKGVFKAMGELGLLFNYIERYLASKRVKSS
ncbi:LOW QUALITY PROTEIN: interleukin-10 [Fundulus heteroclitus]|uniref:LOW QUALITY PROTEIN: interleukin-10 n=1 Tax=Fundulus heteroclitus TaxID=8078 RepID=UPI00165BD1C2|nr:LOW QUALITY PROTEIN: interleukin-10 [Fundulus heteroclitus]